MFPTRIIIIMLVMALSAVAGHGQCSTTGGIMRLTVSYDPLSPESALRDASDIEILYSTCPSVTVAWSRSDLGVPPGGNIDALSDGLDVFPIIGPIFGAFSTVGNMTPSAIFLQYSVDRATIGLGAVAVASSPTCNGAASDTFAVELVTGMFAAFPTSNAQCVTPRPGVETDIDALCWTGATRYPVFFSVDPPTAVTMGVSPADILVVSGPGLPPVVLFSATMNGLVPGDDIDALAVGSGGHLFSLSPSSPTAVGFPAMGSSGLFNLGLVPWALPMHLGLSSGAGPDNLNALRIGDPGDNGSWRGGAAAIPLGQNCGGLNAAALQANVPRIGQTVTLEILGSSALAPGYLYASNSPQVTVPIDAGFSCFIFLDPLTLHQMAPIFTDALGNWSLSIPIPNDPGLAGLSFRFQALVLGQGIEITNGMHLTLGL